MSRRSTAALYRHQPKNIRSGRPTPLDLFEVHQNRLAGVERPGSSCLAGDLGRDDERKAAREMQVFEDFVKRSGLPIDRQSIRKCDPPDRPTCSARCLVNTLRSNSLKCVPPKFLERFLTFLRRRVYRNFFGRVILCLKSRKKIKKSKDYRTDYPIELVFYTDDRVVQPPDMSILSIQESFSSDAGRFRRVWFMGEPNLHYS